MAGKNEASVPSSMRLGTLCCLGNLGSLIDPLLATVCSIDCQMQTKLASVLASKTDYRIHLIALSDLQKQSCIPCSVVLPPSTIVNAILKISSKKNLLNFLSTFKKPPAFTPVAFLSFELASLSQLKIAA